MAKKVQMQRFAQDSWVPMMNEYEVSSSTDGYAFDSPDRLCKMPYKRACERPPNTVAKRNARERKRVHTVNQSFLILKDHLPSLRHKSKRVSKLRILRAAINYMYALMDILDTVDTQPYPSPMVIANCHVHQINYTPNPQYEMEHINNHHHYQQQQPTMYHNCTQQGYHIPY